MALLKNTSRQPSRSILRRYLKNRFFHQGFSDQNPLAARDRWIIVLIVLVSIASLFSFLVVHIADGNLELVLINAAHILLLLIGGFLAFRGRWDLAVFVAGVMGLVFNTAWLVYAHYSGTIGTTPFQLDTYFYLQPIYLILVGVFSSSQRPLTILAPIALLFSIVIPYIERSPAQYLQALLITVPVSFGVPVATAYFLNRAHALLEGMIGQQNVLLREGHHRIKNNLQLLASLISISTVDENSQKLKNEIIARINAIATLEEQIQRSPFFGEIALGPFVEQLVGGMQAMVQNADFVPLFRLHLDSVFVPIEYGPKIGVFLVELITNAYKHAFKEIDDPIISITLQSENDWVVLTYRDNGVGMELNHFTDADSIGIQLLSQIEADLGGSLEIESEQGVMIRLSFPIENPD